MQQERAETARDTQPAQRRCLGERPAPEAGKRVFVICATSFVAGTESVADQVRRGKQMSDAYGSAEGLLRPATGSPRPTDGRRRTSTPLSSGPAGPGPRASRRTAAPGRPRRARARGSARSAAGSSGRPRGSRCSRAAARDRDTQAELLAALDHPAQVLGRRLERPALGDVVDPALDDQHLRVLCALVQAGGDLVGALAVDAAVAEPSPGSFCAPSTPTGSSGRRRSRDSRAASGRGRSRASRP